MESPDVDVNISGLRGGAELNSTGLTTAMGPRLAEKGPSCCSTFRAQQITEYSELKLAHKDHQIPLLVLPGQSHSACGSQKAAKRGVITVHHLELFTNRYW